MCIGTGAALVVTGGVLTGLAVHEREQVSGASRDGDVIYGTTMRAAAAHVDKARSYDSASYALYVLGGAAVVTGVVLWATLPNTAAAGEAARPAFGAAPLPGGVAVSAAWEF